MPSTDDYGLRPLQREDLEQVLTWRNSDRIRSKMYNDSIISWAEHQAWFERISTDESCCHLIFEYRDRPIGLTDFVGIDRYHSRCLWGFYLGETNLPGGSGSMLGYQALNWIFSKQQMRKVDGEVLAFNQPSRNFFKRMGFTEDGRRRQHLLRDGQYVDVILYSLLAKEWTGGERAKVEQLLLAGDGGRWSSRTDTGTAAKETP